jgi:hypothetical protein
MSGTTRRRVKRQVPPESAYSIEVRQEISDSQRADLRQAQAEDCAREAELGRVVEPGVFEAAA